MRRQDEAAVAAAAGAGRIVGSDHRDSSGTGGGLAPGNGNGVGSGSGSGSGSASGGSGGGSRSNGDRSAVEPPEPARSATSGRLARLLFGANPGSALLLRFVLAALVQHLGWAAFFIFGRYAGVLGTGATQLLVACHLLGGIAFYPAVRLGWSAHLKDPGLVLPQMLWASFTAVLAYALAPALRPALLQLLCLVQTVGFLNLRPRQLLVTGGLAMAMLTAALMVGTAGQLPDFSLRAEIYPAALTLGVLACITGLTFQQSIRRDRARARKLELKAAVAAVRDLVIRDSLTGLLNRRHMQELLQIEQARALQTGRSFAVALMDIDHFKRINDLHGHGIGDEVLRRFADLARLAIRQTDTVARWGGEEFLVLMPETLTDSEALMPLTRLQDDLRQQEAASLLGRIGLTFSAGIAFHRLGEPVARSIASADRALYSAKADGRNRLTVADAGGPAFLDTAPSAA